MRLDKVIQDLDYVTSGGDWWSSPTAIVVVALVDAGPLATALAHIAEVLQAGEDPMWVVGGVTAKEALAVAQEWLDAGVDGSEVGDWLRAGCWDPGAARRMVDAGLHPWRLLTNGGEPAHWIEAPNGETMSLAAAVADSYLTAREAVRVISGRSSPGDSEPDPGRE